MSLTNIKLPDFVIEDLYRRSLIQPTASDFGGVPQAMPEGPMPQPEARIVAEPQPVTKTPIKEPVVEKAPEKIIEALPVKAAEPAAYKILGNNKKQITVVVNCPNDVFVPEADLQFLTKMLGACKLNMADVAIVNHATAAVAIERVKLQLQPKYVLLFGVEPGTIQLPISFPSFKEQAYAGTTYLFTPALSELNLETEDAKVLKRKLWDCLKRIFL
jgi:hypothetical protein